MKILLNKYFVLISRLILSLVFIFAGIEKIISPELFAESINNYRLFPLFTINLIAITIPWIELVTGICLLLGITIKDNLKIINSLMLFFILIVFISVLRGLDIDCGCYGTNAAQKVGFIKILENIILFLMGLQIYLCENHLFRINSK
ncbi:MAG: DoxX family membrane protein [Melioribacteraceae bacterium]|nr:DoxX family membrane protein [Melioribacteraceae bacterium]